MLSKVAFMCILDLNHVVNLTKYIDGVAEDEIDQLKGQ